MFISLRTLLRDPDVIQVNANGNVVRSEILGAVKMKCYLSGMPELRLGLNDKVMFESTGRSTFNFSHFLHLFAVFAWCSAPLFPFTSRPAPP